MDWTGRAWDSCGFAASWRRSTFEADRAGQIELRTRWVGMGIAERAGSIGSGRWAGDGNFGVETAEGMDSGFPPFLSRFREECGWDLREGRRGRRLPEVHEGV